MPLSDIGTYRPPEDTEIREKFKISSATDSSSILFPSELALGDITAHDGFQREERREEST
eukprot:197791-Amorphochlora_amoeboformis.AAC.1